MQKLTRAEWETHISIDTVEECAIIDTSIPKDINKCKKLGYEVIRENHYEDGSICNVVFKVPRRAISFRRMEVVNRQPTSMTEERKAKLHSVMKKEIISVRF